MSGQRALRFVEHQTNVPVGSDPLIDIDVFIERTPPGARSLPYHVGHLVLAEDDWDAIWRAIAGSSAVQRLDDAGFDLVRTGKIR